METQQKKYGTTRTFQEEDAAEGISSAPIDSGRSNRQIPSSKHHRYKKGVYENALTRFKEEDITTRLPPSSLHPVSFK